MRRLATSLATLSYCAWLAIAGAAAAAEGGDEDRLLTTAREQLERGEVDEAIATLERAVELEPESSARHHWLGRAYLEKLDRVSMFKKLGYSKKVLAQYHRAIELDPDNVDARASLAGYYFNAPGIAGGDDDLGMEQVGEVAKRDAKRGHVLTAEAHIAKQRPAEAAEALRAAIAADPADPVPRYRLGLLHQGEKSWEAAFEVFETAVGETDDPRCLYQLGRTAVLSGRRLDVGRRAFERYIAEGRGKLVPHAHWRLGMIHEKQGRKDLAREEYETALRLDPDNEEARDALKRLR